MTVTFSARSHTGRSRQNNEDNLFADGTIIPREFVGRPFQLDASCQAPLLLAVCDGMGGEDCGELASEIAVTTLQEHQGSIRAASKKEIGIAVQEYINAADRSIKSYGRRSGTTLALAVINEDGISCFNVGDSRVYVFKDSVLSQVTHDHTQGAELALSGRISPEQARCSTNGNKLTRCLGIGNCCSLESYPAIRKGCRILLCSDGLSDMVSDAEIERILSGSEHISQAAEALLQAALSHGGMDNITLIAAEFYPNTFIEGIIKKITKRG